MRIHALPFVLGTASRFASTVGSVAQTREMLPGAAATLSRSVSLCIREPGIQPWTHLAGISDKERAESGAAEGPFPQVLIQCRNQDASCFLGMRHSSQPVQSQKHKDDPYYRCEDDLVEEPGR